jgi:hypothetical protein
MDALWNALQQGGLQSWLILIVGIVVGIIALRIVFEIAEGAIKIGCFVIFILIIAWLAFTVFGAG